jgi:hypothetical protein
MIDIKFNFYSDAKGGDPDIKSPKLRFCHRILWSKPLPCEIPFSVLDMKSKGYLAYQFNADLMELGSDSIVHSYKTQNRKQWLIKQLPEKEVDDLRNLGSTIGGYIVFPRKKIDGKFTINQARGVNHYVDDRFDLTLECIRRYYLNIDSPLFVTLKRYEKFFDLFVNFENYVSYFYLNDLIDTNHQIKFYLPFDDFKSKPSFKCVDDYMTYKFNVMQFVSARNLRIQSHIVDMDN